MATNAGGGNLTGTARGMRKAGNTETKIVGASVDLQGLHMASDVDFNRKSFTTGHTGFGVPFTTSPDRSDVPRSAARPLRYMDRYVKIRQGEVFFITEALANLEGLEKGPAGNTSLAAAFVLAQEMREDQIILVQETEYTGAGKSVQPQLSFARENGIDVRFGDPAEEIPGKSIILPSSPEKISVNDIDLAYLKQSLVKNVLKTTDQPLPEVELKYLAEEINGTVEQVQQLIKNLNYEVTELENIKFEDARKHLADLSDEELKARFWQLAEEVVEPMLDMGKKYTSPSIERSVLLRMGFSSIEATEIVKRVLSHELMGKGAGHIVYRIAKENGLSVRDAGLKLADGELWEQVDRIFKEAN